MNLIENCVTVVDIGSGSMKASVFRNVENKIRAVASISRGFRLCPHIGASISDKKISITADFFRRVLGMSKTHNSSQVIAVATQAARRAPNFSELQRKILTSLGIDLRIISGTEEATLMASCVRRFMSLDKFISFDIGCGSVEVAEFNGDLKGTWSLPLSTIDLSKMENFKEAEVATEKILKTVKFHDAGVAQYPLVGSGGTLRVANLLMEGGMGKKITCQEVKSLLGTLKNKTNEERVALGVPKVRADVFPYGLLVVCKLMERVQIRELQVMLGNLRLSLAMNYFNTLD